MCWALAVMRDPNPSRAGRPRGGRGAGHVCPGRVRGALQPLTCDRRPSRRRHLPASVMPTPWGTCNHTPHRRDRALGLQKISSLRGSQGQLRAALRGGGTVAADSVTANRVRPGCAAGGWTSTIRWQGHPKAAASSPCVTERPAAASSGEVGSHVAGDLEASRRGWNQRQGRVAVTVTACEGPGAQQSPCRLPLTLALSSCRYRSQDQGCDNAWLSLSGTEGRRSLPGPEHHPPQLPARARGTRSARPRRLHRPGLPPPAL